MSTPPAPPVLPLCPQPTQFQSDPCGGWSEWISAAQSTALVSYWNSIVPAYQILPGSDLTAPSGNTNGIYFPKSDGYYFQEVKTGPDGVAYYWLSARFKDLAANVIRGGSGGDISAGMIMCEFARYPFSALYVVGLISQNIQTLPAVPIVS